MRSGGAAISTVWVCRGAEVAITRVLPFCLAGGTNVAAQARVPDGAHQEGGDRSGGEAGEEEGGVGAAGEGLGGDGGDEGDRDEVGKHEGERLAVDAHRVARELPRAGEEDVQPHRRKPERDA